MIDEITRGFISAMLEDLQYSEIDEACTDQREARDVSQLGDGVREKLESALTEWFARAEPYLAPSSFSLTYDLFEIGSEAYFSAAGHGAGLWDRPDKINVRDGSIISDMLPRIEPYLGDDGKVYL